MSKPSAIAKKEFLDQEADEWFRKGEEEYREGRSAMKGLLIGSVLSLFMWGAIIAIVRSVFLLVQG